MLSSIENLLILQDRYKRIAKVEAELSNIVVERSTLQEKAKATQAGHEAAKLAAAKIESERKSLDLDVEAKKKLIEKYSLQQFQTKKNDEFKALAHEIETCKKAIFTIEDQQIALMERGEAASADVAAAAKSSSELLKVVEKQMSALADRETSLKRQLEELKSDYPKLAAAVDEDLRPRYERLRKSKGTNAVVGIDHEVCGGCHMKLARQVVLSCQAQQEIVTCPNCGRILYYSRQMDMTPTD